MALTRQQKRQLNGMCNAARRVQLGKLVDEATEIDTDQLADGAVTEAKLGPNVAGILADFETRIAALENPG